MTTKFRKSLNGKSQPAEELVTVPFANLNSPPETALSESSALRGSWFSRLPIRRKPLLTMLATDLLTVLGLAGASSLLLLWGGRTWLEGQAQRELGV